MTENEAKLITNYPETTAIVEMARAAWNGVLKSSRIDFSLSKRLQSELKKLLGKEINIIFITDSDVRHIKKNHGKNESGA